MCNVSLKRYVSGDMEVVPKVADDDSDDAAADDIQKLSCCRKADMLKQLKYSSRLNYGRTISQPG
jgi:hypothetical protein